MCIGNFRFSSLTMCASKLANVLRRFDVLTTVSSCEHFFACHRFVFRMLCRFLLQSVRDLMCVIVRVFICIGVLWPGCHDCQQSSRLAKILVEGKRYASKRMYIQRPALESEDLCHQVGFGPWSSLCDRRSVWLFKSLTSRIQWFEIGMSVRSQNSEYVVRFTSRLKLEPRES